MKLCETTILVFDNLLGRLSSTISAYRLTTLIPIIPSNIGLVHSTQYQPTREVPRCIVGCTGIKAIHLVMMSIVSIDGRFENLLATFMGDCSAIRLSFERFIERESGRFLHHNAGGRVHCIPESSRL